jgi:DNA-binding response OmpR family regulator
MTTTSEATDIVLVVDDEESVRRTVRDWLAEADLGVQVLTAVDSESALLLANQHTIDLAILDWNLGAGMNGLDLLQDLAEFQPNIVAIMMTAYADQATPLDAMRRGVRDYLDKNQELNRKNFLTAVRRQLDQLRPAKRERRFHQSLVAFRNAVEKALPLVQSLAALTDPVTLPEAISTLFRFLVNTTRASTGVLFVRHYDPHREAAEDCRVFSAGGEVLNLQLVPFPQSVAATAVSLQEPCAMTDLERRSADGSIALQPFEKGHDSLLAAPLAVTSNLHVVLELFDKKARDGKPDPAGFTDADIRLVREAGQFGAELLRQTLAERQTHQVLFDAVEAALRASETVTQTIEGSGSGEVEDPPPNLVLEQLRERLSTTASTSLDPSDSVRLAEAIRVLAVRHGSPAVRHCIQLVESLRQVLDQATGL